jgi:HSP20 family protein
MKRRTDLTPWQDINLFGNRMSRFFDPDLDVSMSRLFEGAWIPPIELLEEDGEFRLTAELAGIPREDVDISLDDGVLTLKGEKNVEQQSDEGRTHIRERRYGTFERSFTLPRSVDTEKIRAEFEDGVLTIHMPKGEGAAGRHIRIQ